MTDTKTFWALKTTEGYGISLVQARRLREEEKAGLADWYRELGMVGLGDQVALPYITWRDNPQRQSDGCFSGSENHAWTLSADEVRHYMDLDAQRKQAAEAKQAAGLAAASAARAAIIRRAQETGQRQELRRWVTKACTARKLECSFDIAVEYCMPDGATLTDYSHCY